MNKTKSKKIFVILFILIIIFLIYKNYNIVKTYFGFATIYDSVADRAVLNDWKISDNSYAWGENVGWIDFAPTQGSTYVADNALWGYAYGESIGWISLNCANSDSCDSVNYKVLNNGEGKLSGYAWAENVGWIDFGTSTDITNRPWGVSITSGGDFTGYAYGENIGWISFNSANGGSVVYKVSTSWRPQSTRPQCNNGLDDDGDGDIDMDDPNCISIEDDAEKSQYIPITTNSTLNIKYPNGGEDLYFGKNYYLNVDTANIPTGAIIYIDIVGFDGKIYPLSERSVDNIALTNFYFPELLKEGKYKIRVTCKSTNPSTNEFGYCSADGTLESNPGSQDYSDGFFDVSYPYIGYSTTTHKREDVFDKENVIPIKKVDIPVKDVDKLVIKDLPDFITKEGITFVPQFNSFLFGSLPSNIMGSLSNFSELGKYLKDLGFYRAQDYARISKRPLILIEKYPLPKGLFLVKENGSFIRTRLVSVENGNLAQNISVKVNSVISLYLVEDIKESSLFVNGKKFDFSFDDGYMYISLDMLNVGRNILYTNASPFPILIDVIDDIKEIMDYNIDQTGIQNRGIINILWRKLTDWLSF